MEYKDYYKTLVFPAARRPMKSRRSIAVWRANIIRMSARRRTQRRVSRKWQEAYEVLKDTEKRAA